MGLDSIARLVVAALDLKEVQLIRAAMRNADIASGKGQAVSSIGPAPDNFTRRFHLHPEAKIESRKHLHPEAVIEPRKHACPVDRFEPSNARRDVVEVPVVAECPTACHKRTIQAPWDVLPWQQATPQRVAPQIKVVVKPPDIALKGTLLDCFI